MITVDAPRAVPGTVSTRPRTPQDEAHLRAVYASTRVAELAPLGWPPEHVDRFLAMQFDARERSLSHGADDHVVEVDGVAAGRLIVDAAGPPLRLVDIALLPQFRGCGVGGELLARLCARADAEGREIVLHVVRDNPVAALYRRCGFEAGADDSLYAAMRRPPVEHS